MKYFLILFLISIGSNAQTLTELSKTHSRLDEALVKKDTAELNLILHKNASITHSNGFTENKSQMKQNTISSFIKYNKIEQSVEAKYVKIDDDSYLTYRHINVSGIYDVYDFQMNLRLMEVWIWEQNRWQLIGRQSLELKEKK